MFSCEILQILQHLFQKTFFEWLLMMVVIYCIKNWIKLLGTKLAFCFILEYKITLFYLLSSVFNFFIARCHSLSLIVIFCYSLSLVVIPCHPFLFVVTRCTTRCHSLYHPLTPVVPLVCLFINHLIWMVFIWYVKWLSNKKYAIYVTKVNFLKHENIF